MARRSCFTSTRHWISRQIRICIPYSFHCLQLYEIITKTKRYPISLRSTNVFIGAACRWSWCLAQHFDNLNTNWCWCGADPLTLCLRVHCTLFSPLRVYITSALALKHRHTVHIGNKCAEWAHQHIEAHAANANFRTFFRFSLDVKRVAVHRRKISHEIGWKQQQKQKWRQRRSRRWRRWQQLAISVDGDRKSAIYDPLAVRRVCVLCFESISFGNAFVSDGVVRQKSEESGRRIACCLSAGRETFILLYVFIFSVQFSHKVASLPSHACCCLFLFISELVLRSACHSPRVCNLSSVHFFCGCHQLNFTNSFFLFRFAAVVINFIFAWLFCSPAAIRVCVCNARLHHARQSILIRFCVLSRTC